MKKELERLSNMLRDHKISAEDYQLLTSALSKKSMFDSIEKSWLINPFQKIGGWQAVIIGLGFMIVMSFVGVYAHIFYDGFLGYLSPIGIKTKLTPSFFLLLYQNTIACLMLTIFYFLAAKLLNAKGVRFIDVMGAVTLSRYPLLISVILTSLEDKLRPDLLYFNPSQGFEMHFSLFGAVSGMLLLFCVMWQIVTYFFAFKESSGLTNKRLWISFVFIMALGDAITMIGSRVFLYLS